MYKEVRMKIEEEAFTNTFRECTGKKANLLCWSVMHQEINTFGKNKFTH